MTFLIILIIVVFLIIASKSVNKSNQEEYTKKLYSQKNKKDIVQVSFGYDGNVAAEKQPNLQPGTVNHYLNGMKFQNLNVEHIGSFTGTAIAVSHPQDTYCVEVRNNKNELLGYIPKNNSRLHNTIKKYHDGHVFCWGWIDFNDHRDDWQGNVSIPLRLNEGEYPKIKKILELEEINTKLSSNKANLETNDFFNIFNNYIEASNIYETLDFKSHIEIYSPSNLIPGFTQKLATENDWASLLKMEKYEDLIYEMNEKSIGATLRRIEKAKLMT